MMIKIRNGTTDDLDFLLELESRSFDQKRSVDRKSLARSLKSLSQQVLIAEVDGVTAASAIFFVYKKTIRIYSVAVLPENRQKGVGRALVQSITGYAKSRGYVSVALECDAGNEKLSRWYEGMGFIRERKIEDYYAPGEDAFKMRLHLRERQVGSETKKKNIVVADIRPDWLSETDDIEVIEAVEYITGEKYQNGGGYRIFNLCSSFEYQSIGYYVSLLAAARDQRVIPNVTTIRDFYSEDIVKSLGTEEQSLIRESLRMIPGKCFELKVHFGQAADKRFMKLGKALYRLFEAPFLTFHFQRDMDWRLIKVIPSSPDDVDMSGDGKEAANAYFGQKRFGIPRFREYRYDLAMLIDPEEDNPPSCKRALEKFRKAAEKTGFFVDFIYKEDYGRIGEYDALFIRSTTDVRNYTYEFSRTAYAEGLAVIDDPWSILKCSNKLFLAERMKKGSIPVPESILLEKTKKNWRDVEKLGFPVILKKPDSAFSIGVYKADNEERLMDIANMLFKDSELIVAQEYIKTDFDWRIGVLDNEPIFACKYYMARNHWQIYNWESRNKRDFSGAFETLPLWEVPPEVLKTAVRACSLIGDGLYGVDIKQSGQKVYLVEVNDNPNIDAGIEDRIAKDGLYMKIMESMLRRIENSRDVKRPVSG